jgi:hypothetical protein
MNIYTYDFELQTMTTMLMNCFSDIIIKRFNVNRDPRDQIKTRVVYAPKQRVLNDLLDKDQNLQLPVISVQIGGIARDENRVFNKLLGTFHHPANTTYSLNEKGPQPIDVTYNLSIMTRYQQDMDQILSHLLPYINPYFVVSWRTPQRPDFEIRSNVIWNGQANVQYPVELNANQVARVVADLSFVFKGWLFQNQTKHENIFTFDNSYTTVNIAQDFAKYNTFDTSYTRDELRYSVKPPQPQVVLPYFASSKIPTIIEMWGKGFNETSNIYLSGNCLSSTSVKHDPFALFSSLSAANPPLTAVKLSTTEWSVEESKITFTLPALNVSGFVDILVENPSGYGSLIKNVKIDTFNPFLSGTADFNKFKNYQLPYLSGIQII